MAVEFDWPPNATVRKELHAVGATDIAEVSDPILVAFPVVAKVMALMVNGDPAVVPPAHVPREPFDPAAANEVVLTKVPNDVALPGVARAT